MRTVSTIALLIPAGCASVPRGGESPTLPSREMAVVSVLLRQEAKHPERPRPILILNPSEPEIPPDLQAERPPEFPADLWEKQIGPLPQALRDANSRPYSLIGIPLPPGAQFFPREEFDRAYESEERFKALVKRLGGVEPLVLKVSRPSFAVDGTATVLLHVQSTWSGCGGIDEYIVPPGSGTADLRRVLVIW